MSFYLLILVSGCLMTGYFLCKNSHKEIAHLLGIFGSLGVIAILVLCPWEILLVLLIFVFISISKDFYANKFNLIETENQQQDVSALNVDSQLVYRGVPYCINSNIKLAQVKVQKVTLQLHYRGNPYFICVNYNTKNSKLTTPLVTYQLKFRGRHYKFNDLPNNS